MMPTPRETDALKDELFSLQNDFDALEMRRLGLCDGEIDAHVAAMDALERAKGEEGVKFEVRNGGGEEQNLLFYS